MHASHPHAQPRKRTVLHGVRRHGLTATRTEGEWRVNYRNGAEATAYYTSDGWDAIATAEVMAAEARFNRTVA